MREDRGRTSVPDALFLDEIAAQQRLYAQDVQEVLGDTNADEALRLANSYEVEALVFEEGEVAGERLERLVHLAVIAQVGRARRDQGHAAFGGLSDPREPLRFFERQGAQHEWAHDAEYGGVCTHSQADDECRECKETGLSLDGAKRVACILGQAVHPMPPLD